jgi:hypothetical protein
MSSNSSLALLAPLLTAQLDSIAVVLKDTAARIETIKAAAAQAAEVATPPQPVETSAPDPDRDDPNRIVSLREAARLSSLSIDTLRRRHRGKFVQLSERRFGMRKRDALLL